MKATLYTDGGARPTNPGHAAIGVVLDIEGEKNSIGFGRYIGIKTNNEAEFTAALVGVKLAIDRGASEILIFTDSKLVEGALVNDWNIKDTKLKPLVREIVDLLEKHFEDAYNARWIKRDNNSLADSYATEAAIMGKMMKESKNAFTAKAKRKVTRKPKVGRDPFSKANS